MKKNKKNESYPNLGSKSTHCTNTRNQPKALGWVSFVKLVGWMHTPFIWFIEINGYKHQEQNIMFTKEYICEGKFLGDLKPQSRAWFDRGLASRLDLECWATSKESISYRRLYRFDQLNDKFQYQSIPVYRFEFTVIFYI